MKRKAPILTFTPSFHGVQHLDGIPKRYQITMTTLSNGKADGYIADKENHPFTRARECYGSVRYVRSQCRKWGRIVSHVIAL